MCDMAELVHISTRIIRNGYPTVNPVSFLSHLHLSGVARPLMAIVAYLEAKYYPDLEMLLRPKW